MNAFDYSRFIGEKIGGCEIVKEIGRGAIGVVF